MTKLQALVKKCNSYTEVLNILDEVNIIYEDDSVEWKSEVFYSESENNYKVIINIYI